MSKSAVDVTSHRGRWPWLRIFRIILMAPFLLLVLCWLVLYCDSRYQRHKAEKLLRDLKAFPFATANFVEVREFVLAHGGRPSEGESRLVYRPLLPPPPPPYPPPSQPGVVGSTLLYFGGTQGCTPQECDFDIQISNRLSWLLLYRDWARSFYLDLDSLGVRPWDFRTGFYFSNGNLQATTVGFVSAQAATWRSTRELLPTVYSARIAMEQKWPDGKAPYDIIVRVKGGKVLESMVRPTASAEITRALDIDMSCATRLSRGCEGFGEVIPSAWADYQVMHKGWQPPGWSEEELGTSFSLTWLFVGGAVFVGTFVVIGALLERLRREKPANRRIMH